MDRLSAPEQNAIGAYFADLLRKAEMDSGPEFLPRGLDVMGLVRQLALPSSETVEKLSYGDPLFRMPTQSNIPITTDRGYVAEVLGMAPAVPAASRATTRISNEMADQLVRAITGNPQATAPAALEAAGQMAPLARIFSPEQAKTFIPETKAIDESGNPIMVFHGTTQAKDLGKEGKFGSWRSAWFTDNPVVAGTYAKGRQEFGTHRGRALFPSYLDMKNPFVVDARGNSWRSVPAVLPNEGGDELYYTTDKLAKFARQNGYDGLIVKNVFDPGSGRMPTTDAGDRKLTGTTYVVFDPEKQVKSATSDPTFSGLLDE
jgi:hypothetical protein